MKFKNLLKASVFVAILLSSQTFYSQNTCTVLMEGISGVYKGKCKKGFANGKGIATGKDTYEGHFKKGLPNGFGTYKWESGEVYIGKWKKGKRNGMGKYTFQFNNKDSVLEGIWKNDKYLGPKPKRPKVHLVRSVDRYNIQRISDGNQIRINFLRSNAVNPVRNLIIDSNYGHYTKDYNSYVFENVKFPFNCSIRYTTLTKLGKSSFSAQFEFTIYEEGSWSVTLNN